MTITLVSVLRTLPASFDTLCGEAHDEGYRHMERLATDWMTGAERFDNPGESLFAAVVVGELAGVGGITVDPINHEALRMRRFYVRPAFRRHGVGRRLAEAAMAKAGNTAHGVVVNAPTELAARFWEALGFVPDRRDGHTHALTWRER